MKSDLRALLIGGRPEHPVAEARRDALVLGLPAVGEAATAGLDEALPREPAHRDVGAP